MSSAVKIAVPILRLSAPACAPADRVAAGIGAPIAHQTAMQFYYLRQGSRSGKPARLSGLGVTLSVGL